MRSDVFISHVTGRCSACGAHILDSGYDDDPDKWDHEWVTEDNS